MPSEKTEFEESLTSAEILTLLFPVFLTVKTWELFDCPVDYPESRVPKLRVPLVNFNGNAQGIVCFRHSDCDFKTHSGCGRRSGKRKIIEIASVNLEWEIAYPIRVRIVRDLRKASPFQIRPEISSQV